MTTTKIKWTLSSPRRDSSAVGSIERKARKISRAHKKRQSTRMLWREALTKKGSSTIASPLSSSLNSKQQSPSLIKNSYSSPSFPTFIRLFTNSCLCLKQIPRPRTSSPQISSKSTVSACSRPPTVPSSASSTTAWSTSARWSVGPDPLSS